MKSKHATQTSVNSISNLNKFKMVLSSVSEGCRVVQFQPLKSWPAVPHERQAEIDSFLRAPSAYS